VLCLISGGVSALLALAAALPAPEPKPLVQLNAPLHSDRLEAARAMAKENPAAVANIVRGWVNGTAGEA